VVGSGREAAGAASLRRLAFVGEIVVRAGSASVLVAFLALTAVFNTPVNPLKIELQPAVIATIGTYFPQNWSLFAPDPLSDDYELLIRPLSRDEAARFAAVGVLPEKGWVDLSGPLWERFQENRFSAYDRLARPITNGLRDYFAGSTFLATFVEACRKGDTDACAYVSRQRTLAHDLRGPYLARIASGYCNGVHAGSACEFVALRARITRSVPWSERDTGKPEIWGLDLGVFPIERSARSSGVFAPAVP
jgi:hypothetical protein